MKKILIVVALLVVIIALGVFFFIDKPKFGRVDEAAIATASYQCEGDVSIDTSFYEGKAAADPVPGEPPVPTGKVLLRIPDSDPLLLNQTISADGGRYANSDETVVFWDKGNGAMFMPEGETEFSNCIKVTNASDTLPQTYAHPGDFSVHYPEGFTVDENYVYQALGPDKEIAGVKFTIPTSLSEGTNLSTETYLSVENIPDAKECSAALFLGDGTKAKAKTITEEGTTYSVASTTDAAAGNRYHEIVYALPGTNPCRAIRYFIHYGVLENYPTGAVKGFDEPSLIAIFDSVRKTLIIAR